MNVLTVDKDGKEKVLEWPKDKEEILKDGADYAKRYDEALKLIFSSREGSYDIQTLDGEWIDDVCTCKRFEYAMMIAELLMKAGKTVRLIQNRTFTKIGEPLELNKYESSPTIISRKKV